VEFTFFQAVKCISHANNHDNMHNCGREIFTFMKTFLNKVYSFSWNFYHHLNDDKSLQVHLKPWMHEHIKAALCILCCLRFFIYICTLLKWTPAIELALYSWTSKRHGYRSVYHGSEFLLEYAKCTARY